MKTPNTLSRLYEFCSPKLDASARVVGIAADRAARETMTRWRVNRLFWIKDAVLPALGPDHGQGASASSEPENPASRSWSGDVEVDVRSPISQEAFHAMPFSEQVGLLRTWEPQTSNWDGPVREGLAGILQEEVRSQPLPFFEDASQFIGLDPLYSTALMRGLLEGLDGKRVSDWQSLWALARWILEQPDAETEIRDEFSGQMQLGRRWQSCRLEIARLIDAALNHKLGPLPLSERASVWQLIDVLTHDPSPSLVDETREDQCIMHPFAVSLNTVRGLAVHAVFSYIRWIRSFSPKESQGAQDLNDVREVRETLEAILDPRLESSLTIRSVLGANLSRLAYWADAWLRNHLEQILPVQSRDEQWKTAWEAFIRFSSYESKSFALLHQQYSVAVNRMSRTVAAGHLPHDPRVRLGQHLVLSYCRGLLNFEQPGNLLTAFFARVSKTVRTEVVAYIGESLAQSNQTVSPEQSARLLRLWNWLAQHECPSGGPGLQPKAA
jgi:hypothetical protein